MEHRNSHPIFATLKGCNYSTHSTNSQSKVSEYQSQLEKHEKSLLIENQWSLSKSTFNENDEDDHKQQQAAASTFILTNDEKELEVAIIGIEKQLSYLIVRGYYNWEMRKQ